ncbi:unnamed protein product, partial [Prorocentrum cordatum]
VLQSAGEGDEAQAAKEAAAHLDEAEAALERVRGDAADAQRPPRAISGGSSFLARSSLLDGEGGAEGPPGESGDPAAGSAGPAAASASAGIGLNGSVAGWFGPDPQDDLEQVAQWASWLSGGGARGAAAAATVRESPGDAAQTLRFLAETGTPGGPRTASTETSRRCSTSWRLDAARAARPERGAVDAERGEAAR